MLIFGVRIKRCYQSVPRNDTAYWGGVVEQVSEIMRKYPGQLSKDLALAILGDLERRSKENEGQDTRR